MSYAHTYEFAANQAWDFEATFDAPAFADVVEAVAPLSGRAVLEIDPEEIRVAAFDPAKVAAVEARKPCVRETDGELDVEFPCWGLTNNWPGYYPDGTPTYTLEVHHSDSGEGYPKATVHNDPEGRFETDDVYAPEDRNRLDEWPDREFDHEVTLSAPKIHGVLTGMASAADSLVRITPAGDAVRFEADDDLGNWVHEWVLPLAGVGGGEPQDYSADYLRDIASGMWPTGYYKVRFGRNQPLELETDGLRYIQAPRPMED